MLLSIRSRAHKRLLFIQQAVRSWGCQTVGAYSLYFSEVFPAYRFQRNALFPNTLIARQKFHAIICPLIY